MLLIRILLKGQKTYSPFPEKKNDAVYEKSQRQRALERSIRYAKREKSLAERIGDREAIDNANAKVRARQKGNARVYRRYGQEATKRPRADLRITHRRGHERLFQNYDGSG